MVKFYCEYLCEDEETTYCFFKHGYIRSCYKCENYKEESVDNGKHLDGSQMRCMPQEVLNPVLSRVGVQNG